MAGLLIVTNCFLITLMRNCRKSGARYGRSWAEAAVFAVGRI